MTDELNHFQLQALNIIDVGIRNSFKTDPSCEITNFMMVFDTYVFYNVTVKSTFFAIMEFPYWIKNNGTIFIIEDAKTY